MNLTHRHTFRQICQQHNAEPEFEDWLSVLKKKKSCMTENAWKRRVLKLQRLISEGYDVSEVLARSADGGWTGLFPVRDCKPPEHCTDWVDWAKKNGKPLPRPGEELWQYRQRISG